MGSSVYIEQPRYIAHVKPPACHVASLQEGPRFVAEVTGPGSFAVVARGIVMLPGASSINDIAGLAEALAGKQPVGSYAAASHGHAISDVTGLGEALAGKQPVGSYALAGHGHGISDVTGLGEALAGKQPVGSYALADHGHGISDVTGLGEALAGKQAVIPALPTTARLAYPATLPSGQRDVLVWDTIWQCYFRYVEATASWQQVSVPRHDDTTMNSLPNPEAGYKVWNTTWAAESTYTGSFWQEERRVVKPTSTTRQNTASNTADPHLRISIPAGTFKVEGDLFFEFTPDGGRRLNFNYPNLASTSARFLQAITNNGVSSFVTNLNATNNNTGSSVGTGSIVSLVGSMTFSTGGIFELRWSQNTSSIDATILLRDSYLQLYRIV